MIETETGGKVRRPFFSWENYRLLFTVVFWVLIAVTYWGHFVVLVGGGPPEPGHQVVRKKRARRRIGHPGEPEKNFKAPNDTWTADFKGQFKTRDGVYCYPLTVADAYSRYLLGCRALLSTCVDDAKPVFRSLFKEYGLPKRIRTDNGVPFATNTLARLSRSCSMR